MMMETTMSRSLRLMFSGGVALGIGMLAQPVLAQTTPDAGAAPVQRVEITGSNIRRIDAETPSPVQVITADDMKKSGFTSVSEVLQNITANGQGTLSNMSAASFASGASGISLRGFSTGATLVLIDGHRMAPYPLPDNAQYSFVDISNIPFDTIERIEVLKDGASAVYGSDAIAGVVNVILKKSYVGTKVNADAGASQGGGAGNLHASVIHGFGNLDEDGYNMFASLEVRKTNQLSYADREGDGQWASPNFSSSGGLNRTNGVISPVAPFPYTQVPYLLNTNGATAPSTTQAYFQPGASCTTAKLNSATGCPWFNPHEQLAPASEQINLLVGFTKRLSDGWTLNLKGSMFQNSVDYIGGQSGFPQNYVQGLSAGFALSANQKPTIVGPATIPSITIPANYPGNGLGVPATLFGQDPASPVTENKLRSRALRFAADLDGTLGDWDIKAAFGASRDNVTQNLYGSMNVPAFNAAINRATNPFNVFSNNNSAADMATIFPSMYSDALSELVYGELHATRTIMQLDGGDAGFSAGASYVHRNLQSPAPNLVAEGIIGGNPVYASGQQNDASVYGELVLPVLKTLELDFDERFDHIDTTGNAVTGKAAFKWSPINAFALRGAASTGFRAPNVSEAGNTGSLGYFTPTYDPVLCPGGPSSTGIPPKGAVINLGGTNYCNFTPAVLTQGNPNLQPERSKSFTLGAIIEPIKGWSSTIDLYKIQIADQIVNPTPSYQTTTPVRSANALPASAGQCSDGTATGVEACTGTIDPILYYPNGYINANTTTVEGMEVGTRYKFKLGEYGTLKTELDWTHVMSYVLEAGGVRYQLADTHGPSAISNDTGNPQDRVQLTFGWDKGPLNITTTFNWIGSFSITDPSAGQDTCAQAASFWFNGATPPSNYCKVPSFLTTNLTANYALSKQWNIHAGIGNLFDRQSPVDLETYGNVGGVSTNPALYSAGIYGRTYTLGASYTF